MPEYGVTNKGFVRKRFDAILSSIQDQVSAGFGYDISQKPQSMLNSVFLYPIANELAALWEVAEENYFAKYPASAEGVSLDNACQYGNIFRKGNQPTEYTIHVAALDGTTVPKGSLIKSITNPAVTLKCAKSTTVQRSQCNIIAVKPVVVGEGTYTVTLNNNAYSYTAAAAATAETIVGGLANAINETGYTVTVSDDEKYLVITDSVRTRSNEVALTNNLTTEYVTSCVSYHTVDYGEIILPNNTITMAVSNVTGLRSVVNLVAPKPGRVQQTDAEFRQDYFRKSYANSSSQTNSIESYLLEHVDNVISSRCYENVTMVTDEYGIPAKSLEVIVDGGDEVEIADAICATKPGGIGTYGSVTQDIVTSNGDTITINFNRPTKVYAWIKVVLTQGSSAVDPNYVDIVRDAIIDNSDLTIGDNFMSQQYISKIYAALPGIMYCSITVATGSDATTEPASGSFEEGNIVASQREKIDLDPTRIEVTISS